MKLDIEKLEEVPRIGCHDGEIMFERVPPEEHIGLAAEAGVRSGQRIYTKFGGPLHQLGR